MLGVAAAHAPVDLMEFRPAHHHPDPARYHLREITLLLEELV